MVAWEVAAVAATGNDPVLDCLLLRLHTETACCRGGALALRPCDLDPDQCLIQLHEKRRNRAVAASLADADDPPTPVRCAERNSPADGRLLLPGRQPIDLSPATTLFGSGSADTLPWVAAQQISTHWLRHTTLTWVERNFGYAVARASAGHTDGGGKEVGATATYVRATLREVAAALAALTGESHPLA